MKKIINIFFVFLVLFSSFSVPVLAIDTESQYGIVRAEIGINVRDGAGTTHKVIGTGIANSQVVTILETVNTDDNSTGCASGIWYKIKYLQVEEGYGYACSNFVEVLNLEIDDEFEAAVLTFPESYRESLRLLHAIYPNAVFRVYQTGLDFNEVVDNENIEGKNLLWDNNNSRDGLKLLDSYDIFNNSFKNNYPGGGSVWYAPNKETIAYYIDPRNFLNEMRVFMFESLSYNSMYHNIEGVEKTLKNSFMYDSFVDSSTEKKFSDVIMEAGVKYGISPYYIASRILQETGPTRSALVLGTYPNYPEYNSYYNFYNFGATGTEIVKNGLIYAYNKGWNSEEKAIIGGAELLSDAYISAGQDTSYSQKWNVVCKTGEYACYTHQYMQNIEAPYSEAAITYNAYKNNLGTDMYNAAYVFTIPVYENMPESTILPNSNNPINYLSSLIVNGNLVANFNSLTTNYSITIPSYMTSLNIEASAIVDGAKVNGIGNILITGNQQVIPVTVTALNGTTLTYNITVTLNDDVSMTLNDTLNNLKTGVINGNYLSGLTSVDVIKEAFYKANSAALIEIKDASGNLVNDGSVGTGYKVNITVGEEVKVLDMIIYGDTSGDSEITILDLLEVQRYLLNMEDLIDSRFHSADINKDEKITILDLLLIQRHLLQLENISQ